MKLKSFKTLIASAIFLALAGGLVGQSVTSAAVSTIPPPIIPVIGPQSGMFISGYANGPTGDGSLNPILNSMNITLNTKLADLGMYLHGNENMGNGLIELLMSMNAKLSEQNAVANNQGLADDLNARVRLKQEGDIQDALARGVAMDGSTMRNIQQACEEATFAGGVANSVAATAQVAQVTQAVLTQNLMENKSGADRLGSIIGQHTQYCRAEDIKNKRAGCETAQPSTMPGADLNLKTVFTGAVQPGDPTNQSLNADQQKAALAYVNTISPNVPPDAPSSLKDTPSGRIYQASLERYRGRASAISDGFASDIALNSSPSDTKNAVQGIPGASVNLGGLTSTGFGQNGLSAWSGTEKKWNYLFGSAEKWPSAPSEWDVLKYDVFSRYADADPTDPQSWQIRVGSFTPQEGIQELARMQALQLRLSFMLVQQMQENNRLQRLELAQKLDPLTASGLNSQLQNLTSQ